MNASDCVFEKSTRAAVHSLSEGKVTVKNSDMLNGDSVGVNCGAEAFDYALACARP